MRIVRRLLQIVAFVLTLIVGAVAAALIVSQTAWFKNWVRGYIVSEANQYLNGQLTIERLGGNLLFGVELENIGISMDGAEVVSVQDLGLDYNAFDFISRGMSIDAIRLNKPVLYLRRDGDTWSIAKLVKKQQSEADREGPISPIEIGAIGISDGSVVIDRPVGTAGVRVPQRLDRLDAQLSFKYQPVRYSIEITHVSFRGSEPSLGVNAVSGGVAVRDDTLYLKQLALRTEETSLSIDGAVKHYLGVPVLSLQVSSDRVSLPELAGILPALDGIRLQPAFELKAAGPLDRLAVDMNVRSSAGQITGQIVADALAPDLSVTGRLSVRHLDLAPILRNASQKSDLTADARVDLHAREFTDLKSLRGSVSVQSPRVAFMGYAAERVKADLSVKGTDVVVDAKATAYGANATTAGRVSLPIEGAPLTYDLHGQARAIDLKKLPPALKVPLADTDINAEYRVQGTEPAAGKKGANRARHVTADLRFGGSRVAGAAIVSGSTANVSLEGDDLAYRLDASVAGLDLRQVGHDFNVPALTAERYEGTLGGRVAAEGRITGLSHGITLDNIETTARVTLDPSHVGDLAIDGATLDADYRNHSADVRQLEIAARDLDVKASGTVGLDATGQSDLTFHASTPHLEEIGKLANVDAAGILTIDATVTGNFSELLAKGRIVGNGVTYGENGALALTTDFEARVPELTVERTSVTADSKATFVTVGGQNVNEVAAKTIYAGKELQFEATARQPERSLAANGSATFHPDHQEVHLQKLTIDTQGLSWQLEPGSEAAVRYGNDVLELQAVKLVSGDQQIAADGTFGRTGNALTFTATNVDLSGIDAVLMRPPQFSGRLSATGRLEGSKEQPRADAEFQVKDGAFRQFKYQSLGGTIAYAGPELRLDAKLQQNATQWLSAKGTLPVALISPPASEDDAPATAGPIDLTIDSSPIDLGIVQGFTTAVTGVTGSLEAHVRLTGTAGDPRPEGTVTLSNGAMTVADTGVGYRAIAGRIDLHPDRVHVDQITVLDNHDSALSVTGDLAVHARQLGDVQLYVTANDFKVIDNKMGNVRVESSLEVSGDLRAPHLGGYFAIATGRVNLDEILAVAGPSPYAIQQAELVTPASAASEQPRAANPFDALTIDVELDVPNDLVIQASSLQTPGAPIGLGRLNVTLGGGVRVLKGPSAPPQLSGAINTIRGNYDFQGRRFEILRDGSVRFDGVDELNPRLDIRTRRVIQGVEAFVNIRGTVKEPEIVLTSNPPLEQADILALVVFNQPLNQLGEGQQISLAARAQSLAAGAVANQLAQSIGGALHLDTFEIEVAPDSSADALVRIGQQVGQNLYVKVEQTIGNESLTNFIVEYELTRWLRLQTNVLQGTSTQQSVFRRVQDTGIDLIYFFSY